MIERIEESRAPCFMFLHYDAARWHVSDLFLVPRYFLSPAAIERRRPLSATARRAGWIGCNVLISRLPSDARIHAIIEGKQIDPHEAVTGGPDSPSWKNFSRSRVGEPLTFSPAHGKSAAKILSSPRCMPSRKDSVERIPTIGTSRPRSDNNCGYFGITESLSFSAEAAIA